MCVHVCGCMCVCDMCVCVCVCVGGWVSGWCMCADVDKQGKYSFCRKAVHDIKLIEHDFFFALGCYRSVFSISFTPALHLFPHPALISHKSNYPPLTCLYSLRRDWIITLVTPY